MKKIDYYFCDVWCLNIFGEVRFNNGNPYKCIMIGPLRIRIWNRNIR
jgi:hypothetical protein